MDLRSFLKDETGIGVYFKNLLLSLAEIDRSNFYYLLSASLKVRFSKEKRPEFTHSSFHDLVLPSRVLDFLWSRLHWPAFDSIFRTSLDLTHSATPLLLPTLGKTVVTVHDLFFIDFPDMVDRDTRKRLQDRIGDSLSRADGVIAISEYTRKDLLEKFPVDPKKVKVIHLGTNKRFQVSLSTAFKGVLKTKYDLPSEFLLFVGAVEPRKNLITLLEALKEVHDRYARIPLIIAGRKGSDYPRIRQRIVQLGLDASVRVLDYLPDEDVQGLYSLASLFVFPSLCEGFGIPLLEAMASGLPIAAAQAAALPEIAGDAALYFPPRSAPDMAESIVQGLEDTQQRDELIQRGRERIKKFNWKQAAQETLAFYQFVVGQGI